MWNLKDKVVLITGASRGIGFALAQRFSKEGAKLVLTARENLGAIEVFEDARCISLDLSNSLDIEKAVNTALTSFGRIDILVNNAGILQQTDFEMISSKELDEVVDIDFKGPFLLAQLVFRQMKKQKKGKIINIASGAGKLGSTKAVHYAACKAALINLTKSLAKLGGAYNINVNAIAPGFIETDMTKEMILEKRQLIESFIPLAKIGIASDVASAVVFLATDAADYITGQTICVDGGHCMV
jgi:3-oxoacyl-[acyl-carrier protein] reductase